MEPGDVLAFAAAVRERNDRRDEREAWTVTHELLAQLIELTSLRRVESLAQAGHRPWRLPPVYHVPRPGEGAKESEVVMSPREFAQMTAA